MAVYAIADLHLSFALTNKKMDIFGSLWNNHPARIEEAWRLLIQPSDIVLLAGDISWAMTLEEVMADLCWIDQLPGLKVIIRGNHDYWWPSIKKLEKVLPPSIKAIHHSSFNINDISICGTRLWDSPTYGFASLYNKIRKPYPEEDLKIYHRELGRLEISLKLLNPLATHKIAMTHYPPISLDLAPSESSELFERYGVSQVVFGHLHCLTVGKVCFGKARGVNYHLTACDFLDFKPLRIL